MHDFYKQLDKAPIDEVIIGFFAEKIFESHNEIQEFYNKTSIKDRFINKESIKSVTFQIGEEPKIAQDIEPGIVLSDKEKKEQLHIETNRIMFVDRNTYKSYDYFMNKFSQILSDIIKYTSKIKIIEFGLRYVNTFSLHPNQIGRDFLIEPTIRLLNSNEQSSYTYATLNNYLSLSNIQSTKNNNIYGTVKTLFKAENSNKIDIIFDIDTHLAKTSIIENVDEFNHNILDLKDLKNQIFFNNFNDAYSMEEFK